MSSRCGRWSNRLAEALRFAKVGAVGFLVDAAILSGLMQLAGWNAYLARAVSFAAAVTVTWYLNRRWTFAHRATKAPKAECTRYFLVQTSGAMLNLAVYVMVVATFGPLGAYPIAALGIGSFVAMFFNFFGARYFVYVAAPGVRSTQ